MTLRRGLLNAVLALWLVGVVGATVLVWRYKMAPARAADAPARWPAGTSLHASADRPSLVFVAHPQCPCTVASVTELARLVDELGGRAQLDVLLVRPVGTEPGFESGTIADRAARIPGARVHVDIDGVEAARFGAHASGTTLLYSRDGTLLFRGGLTISRGHEGRSEAHDRILALVTSEHSTGEPVVTPIFGCATEDAIPEMQARK
jgi:hypothetical protein